MSALPESVETKIAELAREEINAGGDAWWSNEVARAVETVARRAVEFALAEQAEYADRLRRQVSTAEEKFGEAADRLEKQALEIERLELILRSSTKMKMKVEDSLREHKTALSGAQAERAIAERRVLELERVLAERTRADYEKAADDLAVITTSLFNGKEIVRTDGRTIVRWVRKDRAESAERRVAELERALAERTPQVDPERIAQMIAHRGCCGIEHDPANGKLHGFCVVCGVPWPCAYAGPIPAPEEPKT